MPNVIIEAMANGLTVVATDVGAVRLLVNEKTGYLLDSNRSEQIFKTLKEIIDTREEVLQSKKEAALIHVQRFVWEEVIDLLIDEIKKFSLPR
jgi:glycosyltransferase involved in cell wall biosynthesis